MMFELRGRRRRLVRGVYGGLAALLLFGFVGFGIGSEVDGGLLGSSHGGRGHEDAQPESLDRQRERLGERLRARPADPAAWRRLSMVEALAAFETRGHAAGQALAPGGRERLARSVVAYERYLRLVGPRRVERAVARTAARSYLLLGRPASAVATQRLALGRRDAQGHFLLAQYAAALGDLGLTERALDRAIAAASPGQRRALRRQAPGLRRAAEAARAPADAAPRARGEG